ncbi:MAG: hypothetical protein HAW62_06650 [Endozoicomonadaceae bacterium]|nr:hypothetical protein [Endozoicomonadaceae bacterium]
MKLINQPLDNQDLKIINLSSAILEATIIESRGAPKKKALEYHEDQRIETPLSADHETRWVKKRSILFKL